MFVYFYPRYHFHAPIAACGSILYALLSSSFCVLCIIPPPPLCLQRFCTFYPWHHFHTAYNSVWCDSMCIYASPRSFLTTTSAAIPLLPSRSSLPLLLCFWPLLALNWRGALHELLQDAFPGIRRIPYYTPARHAQHPSISKYPHSHSPFLGSCLSGTLGVLLFSTSTHICTIGS